MSRSKLAEAFLPALLDDFAKHGAEAIERVRQANPAGYLRICASLLPKHLAIDDDDEAKHLTEEELEARIKELDEQIAVARAYEAMK